MVPIIISEQDIVNAVCIYTARKKDLKPEDVTVELIYDDDTGFSAEVYWHERKQVLVTAKLIEAIRLWLKEYMQRNPFVGIKLELDDEEGIIAFVQE